MPYILENQRRVLDRSNPDGFRSPSNPGELNYVITMAIRNYLSDDGNGLSYQKINDVIGALEGAKLEFYRRVAAPYEDTKIKMNGDVY